MTKHRLLVLAVLALALGATVSTGAFTGGDEAVDGVYLVPAETQNGDRYAELGPHGDLRIEMAALNPAATTVVDDVFTVATSLSRARVWIEHGNPNVTFYRMDTRQPIGSESNAVELTSGESVDVGVRVRTGTEEVVLQRITVRAAVPASGTTPTPGTPTTTPTATPTGTPGATPAPTPTATPTETPTPVPRETDSSSGSALISTGDLSVEVGGDGRLRLNATVTNGGSVAGRATLPVRIDGERVGSVTVLVGVGESVRVTTTAPSPGPGTHTVSLGGATATVTVETPTATDPGTPTDAPAEPTPSETATDAPVTERPTTATPAETATATPAETADAGLRTTTLSVVTQSGRTVSVSATVTNTGTATVTRTVTVRVDGTAVSSQSVRLGPGERATLAANVTLDGPGTHTIQVGDAATTVTVGGGTPSETEPAGTTQTFEIGGLSAPSIALLVAGAAVLLALLAYRRGGIGGRGGAGGTTSGSSDASGAGERRDGTRSGRQNRGRQRERSGGQRSRRGRTRHGRNRRK